MEKLVKAFKYVKENKMAIGLGFFLGMFAMMLTF